jgi:hypothetical protein
MPAWAAPAAAQGNTGWQSRPCFSWIRSIVSASERRRQSRAPGRARLRPCSGRLLLWVRRELNCPCRRFDTVKEDAGPEGQRESRRCRGGRPVQRLNRSRSRRAGASLPGSGVGGAYVQLDEGDDAPLSIDDKAGAFAWNLAAGLSYDMTRHVTLSAGYRYLPFEGADCSPALPAPIRTPRRGRRHLRDSPDRAALHLLSERPRPGPPTTT